MVEQKILAVFEVEISGEKSKFSIAGEMEVETGKDYDNKDFKYPSFCGLVAKQIIDGKEVNYKPTEETWTGRTYVVADMIQNFVAKTIYGSKLYTTIYIDPQLQKVIDLYVCEEQTVTTPNNLRVPTHVLGNNMFYLSS